MRLQNYSAIMHGKIIFVLLMLTLSFSYSQIIPKKCANPADVAAKRCCPEYNGMVCGGDRGSCQDVTKCNTYSQEPPGAPKGFADNRFNWPMKVFTHVCQCVGNYGGADCGECKFGYIANADGICVKNSISVRKSINALTTSEWEQYREDLMMAKKTDSTRYKVLIGNNTDAGNFASISVYNLFIWIHHYNARNNDPKDKISGQ